MAFAQPSTYLEDLERLPPGFKRTGYDADKQIYYFIDRSGTQWQSKPGHEYGVLTKVPKEPSVPMVSGSAKSTLGRKRTVSNPNPKHTFDRILGSSNAPRRASGAGMEHEDGDWREKKGLGEVVEATYTGLRSLKSLPTRKAVPGYGDYREKRDEHGDEALSEKESLVKVFDDRPDKRRLGSIHMPKRKPVGQAK